MSEIADELERMARELDEAADRTHEARELPKYSDLSQVFAGTVTGYRKSAERLRERAAELRQKPQSVQIGQWWGESCDKPARVNSVFQQRKQMWASFGSACGWRPAAAEDDMLSSARWRYYGNGELPAT